VSPVSAIDNIATTTTSGKNAQALNSEDFLKIMITELTNQDPFEPMKNQELLNQMSTLQQMQSNMDMTESFNSLIGNFQSLLTQDSLSTATKMIGQLVSGPSTSGQPAIGRVVAVNLVGHDVLLELDTGQAIKWTDLQRLGGNSSQDIIGDMAIGRTGQGVDVVGKVVAVEINGDQAVLHIQVHDSDDPVTVPLSNASIINQDTADLLIGYSVEGIDDIKGTVQSVQWTADGVLLNVFDADEDVVNQLALEDLTRINGIV